MPGPSVWTPPQPACPSSKPGRCGGEERGAPTFLILCSRPWRPPSGVVYVGVGEKGPRTPTPRTWGSLGRQAKGSLCQCVKEARDVGASRPGTALPGSGCRKGGLSGSRGPGFAPWCLQGDPGLLGPSPGTRALWDPRGTLEKEGKKGRVGCQDGPQQLVVGRGAGQTASASPHEFQKPLSVLGVGRSVGRGCGLRGRERGRAVPLSVAVRA